MEGYVLEEIYWRIFRDRKNITEEEIQAIYNFILKYASREELLAFLIGKKIGEKDMSKIVDKVVSICV